MTRTDDDPAVGASADPAARDASARLVLVEPVRQRLVAVAAEVLGRLPVDEVPPALRGIARFTPAKRARLGATALAAALDSDEAFRVRVADVVTDASRQLAEALRSGTSTAASDPVDTAVVAYLVRPDGWEEAVAEATARWSAERTVAAEDVLRTEITALRGQVAALTRQVRAAADREREAVARATEAAATDTADVRARVRSLVAELSATQRGAAATQQAAADAVRQAGTDLAARDADLRRARARIAELERAVEGARRGARVERDLDDARLWLLVDTVTEAASGIRRELSLPPPARRPADTVTNTSGVAVDRRSTDDPSGLDRLLALPNAHVIVDGYNVTKAGYPELPLVEQRSRLISGLAALGGQTRAEITLVFDGGDRPPVAPSTPRGIRVLFSDAAETADDLIRRLVAAEPVGRPLVVVSSDHEVQRDAQGGGGWAVASSVLLRRLGQS
jgi:predicted RNA-binding protein with PIN domain